MRGSRYFDFDQFTIMLFIDEMYIVVIAVCSAGDSAW